MLKFFQDYQPPSTDTTHHHQPLKHPIASTHHIHPSLPTTMVVVSSEDCLCGWLCLKIAVGGLVLKGVGGSRGSR